MGSGTDTSPAPAGLSIPSTDIEFRYAEANTLLKWRGAEAPLYVAERIGALATAGDVAGVERFKEIARCMSDLMGLGAATRQ